MQFPILREIERRHHIYQRIKSQEKDRQFVTNKAAKKHLQVMMGHVVISALDKRTEISVFDYAYHTMYRALLEKDKKQVKAFKESGGQRLHYIPMMTTERAKDPEFTSVYWSVAELWLGIVMIGMQMVLPTLLLCVGM